MGIKLHTFTKVFNWCTRNGCPKFTATHREEDNLLTIRMNWQEFEVFMFIDIDSQDTFVPLKVSDDPTGSFNEDTMKLINKIFADSPLFQYKYRGIFINLTKLNILIYTFLNSFFLLR
jgi:hypothetical protein